MAYVLRFLVFVTVLTRFEKFLRNLLMVPLQQKIVGIFKRAVLRECKGK